MVVDDNHGIVKWYGVIDEYPAMIGLFYVVVRHEHAQKSSNQWKGTDCVSAPILYSNPSSNA